MRCDISLGNTRMKFVAGAVLMCLASAASAQSATLVGGGATLPQLAYTGSNAAGVNVPSSGSLLAAYSAISGNAPTTYCPTGSGAGKAILAGNNAAQNVNNACNSANAGFGGTGLTQAAFAGSDAPLSTTDYSAYTAGHTASGAAPVQVPSLAGAIAVAFHKTGVSSLTLTESQICQVFSGQITTWPALRAAGATGVPATATGNITVVYRGDNSGTSFSFSNHLSAVCGAAPATATTAAGLNIATAFKTNQAFASAAASYLSAYAASASATGNAAVVTTVGTTEGAIGYAEAANVVVGSPALYAKVVNRRSGASADPSTFGGTPLTVSAVYGQGIATDLDVNGRPTLTALPATSSCVAVVSPNDYADPTTGYPILAVTYLIGNNQANGSSADAVRNLLFAPYNTTVRNNTFTVGGTGFGFLTAAAITKDKVDACVVN